MPEENWGYVVLVNRDASWRAIEELGLLITRFLGKDSTRPQQPAVRLDVAELRKYEGFYTPRAPRRQLLSFPEDLAGGIRIDVEDGALAQSRLFGTRERLIPVGTHLFRRTEELETTVVFFENSEGVMCYSAFGSNLGPYAERTNALFTNAQIALLVSCVALIASPLLFGMVWISRWAFRRMKA